MVYGKPTRRYKLPEETVLAEEYVSLTMDRTTQVQDVIETALFGKPNYSGTMKISQSDGGIHFHYYYYEVAGDNLCLGISVFNSLQNDAVVYVNTNKDFGSKCEVYLDESESKGIFYTWKPLEEIISDNTKERIIIKTDKKTYTIFVRSGIKELELTVNDFPKLKSIKGLEKFPNLINLSLIGFDY
ncbi:MAG: hypothetical protein K5829_14930 [Treponema sp.]|nr:hypothetical protein [Treponema sp.]